MSDLVHVIFLGFCLELRGPMVHLLIQIHDSPLINHSDQVRFEEINPIIFPIEVFFFSF